MAMQFQRITIKCSDGTGTGRVVFDNPVIHYVIGFSRFSMGYPNGDHHVKVINAEVSGANEGSSIKIDVKLSIEDNSGNEGTGDADITVIALTDVDNPNYLLANAITEGAEIVSNASLVNKHADGISDFYVSYKKGDHHVKCISMAASLNSTKFNFTTKMEDDSSNKNDSETDKTKAKGCCLCCLVNGDTHLRFQDFTLKDKETNDTNLRKYTNDYGILISSFELKYEKSDHHVRQIEVGAKLRTDYSIEGIVVMHDDSKNKCDAACNVKGCLISYEP